MKYAYVVNAEDVPEGFIHQNPYYFVRPKADATTVLVMDDKRFQNIINAYPDKARWLSDEAEEAALVADEHIEAEEAKTKKTKGKNAK